MNKLNIFLGKFGIYLFFISIIIFVSFLSEIDSDIVLILFPIYVIGGVFYLGNNNVDYLEYKFAKDGDGE